MPTENRNWFLNLGPNETKASPLLVALAAVFAGTLLTSNVLANHMLQFFIWSVDAGALTFPVTYIISDVLSEVYGYRWARRVAWTSLAINAGFALMLRLALALPQPDWYDGAYFASSLGNSWRIVVASLVAYFLGDLADDRVFRHMKRKHETMKGFVGRALTSSLAGHFLDTTLFCLIAFAPFAFVNSENTMPWGELPGMIIVGIFLKFAYECAVVPITWKVTKEVRKFEDINNRNK